jgi:hypothetical protein
MNKFVTFTVIALILIGAVMTMGNSGCDSTPTSDTRQQQQQEVILGELTSAVGMPAIKNGRERRIMKDILELRDQAGYVTYAYAFSEMQGKYIYLGKSIGYPFPYATQFTNPEKIVDGAAGVASHYDFMAIPQADPNGLFTPATAEGTWVMLINDQGDAVPCYFENRIACTPFPLPDRLLMK